MNGYSLIQAIGNEIQERCKATIEQTSPLHGARYWQRAEYRSLASAIHHNDPFQPGKK